MGFVCVRGAAYKTERFSWEGFDKTGKEKKTPESDDWQTQFAEISFCVSE